jgi:hypothetical protein
MQVIKLWSAGSYVKEQKPKRMSKTGGRIHLMAVLLEVKYKYCNGDWLLGVLHAPR